MTLTWIPTNSALLVEHGDKTRMGNAHEVLIRPRSQMNALLPGGILPDTQRANALVHQEVNHTHQGSGVEIVVNASRASRS